jgi:hypothetical protein
MTKRAASKVISSLGTVIGVIMANPNLISDKTQVTINLGIFDRDADGNRDAGNVRRLQAFADAFSVKPTETTSATGNIHHEAAVDLGVIEIRAFTIVDPAHQGAV